jgi:hypothetical protein
MPISHKIEAINLIPGSGEFAISTVVMRDAYGNAVNSMRGSHEPFLKTTVANLKLDFPNLKK